MTPPLLRGGQGRSTRDVRASASAIAWLVVAALALLAAGALLR